MSIISKQEYLSSIRERYLRSSKHDKHRILDEFCLTCGYNRKYAIRLLHKPPPHETKRRGVVGRRKRYDGKDVVAFLVATWKLGNLPCAKRLKAMIALCLPAYQQLHGALSAEVIALLETISASTIDRLLAPIRSAYTKHGLATTKPGSLLKHHIPIKTEQWNETIPGYLEADTVAHCGTSVAGMFVYTVNVVDIATGWTEQRAVWGKGERGVADALATIERALPFRVRGFDADNGTEFLNWHLVRYFTDRTQPVAYTRSREYRKNDNAHIEGKNWTHVRQYLGYQRFENPAMVRMLNDLYTSEWNALLNFFLPSMKLVHKQRIGAKVIKRYDQPRTPLERVLASPLIKPTIKRSLQQHAQQLNPYLLQQAIGKKIHDILRLATPMR